MRAATATIFALLILGVVFIILNLEPATISILGVASITQPLGVIVSLAFLGGALIVYFLKTGTELRQTWQDRHKKKASKASTSLTKDYQAGLEALAIGNREEVRRSLERVISQDPDHVGALLALGNLEREAGEVESATQRHITANARQPGSADILRALAEDYAEAGRVDECIRALDDLLAVSPNDKHALSKKRDVLEDARNFDRAIEAHQALLKTGAPDCGKLIALRLKASQEAEAPEQARSHLEAALRHNKKCAAAHRLFGETFFREDNIAGATKAWSSGWKATKDLSLLQRLCEVYVASGQGKKAFKLCRHAKEASPDEPLPALLYAITAYKIEDYQAAESTLAYQPLASNPTAALLRLELSRKLGDPETVSNQIKETLSALQHLSKPYECSDCGDSLDEWTPQCPSCKSWDTIRLTSLLNLDIPIDLEAEAPGNEAAADRTSTS